MWGCSPGAVGSSHVPPLRDSRPCLSHGLFSCKPGGDQALGDCSKHGDTIAVGSVGWGGTGQPTGHRLCLGGGKQQVGLALSFWVEIQ